MEETAQPQIKANDSQSSSTSSTRSMIVLTDQEIETLISKAEELKKHLFRTDFKYDEYLNTNLTEAEKKIFAQEVAFNSNVTAMSESIDNFLTQLSQLDPMTIKIPFEPTVSFINWIREFLSGKLQQGVKIKILTDKSLIAGVEFEFKGKVKDMSIKNEVIKLISEINV